MSKEPVSTIPEAFWAGKQGCYWYTARFQETKSLKTEKVSFQNGSKIQSVLIEK